MLKQSKQQLRPKAIVIMGVAGSGKSTVGQALADALDWRFIEGDNFHQQSNADKIASGTPLTDEDRRPWLNKLRQEILVNLSKGYSLVLSCSALKKSYRQLLRSTDLNVQFVFLKGDYDLIASRMRLRPHPFMRPEMMPSQFEALEEPANALVVDCALPVGDIVDRIKSALVE